MFFGSLMTRYSIEKTTLHTFFLIVQQNSNIFLPEWHVLPVQALQHLYNTSYQKYFSYCVEV